MKATNNLRRWREEKKWTQQDLADRLKTTPISISRIELGNQTPRHDLMTRIEQVFGATKSDFYKVNDQTPDPGIGLFRVVVIPYGDACDLSVTPLPGTRHLLTDLDYPEDTFGTRLESEDNAPRFRAGDAVIIAPSLVPRPNDMVMACVAGRPIIREYRAVDVESGSFDLVALNPAYPSASSTTSSIRLLGVVVEHRQYRI